MIERDVTDSHLDVLESHFRLGLAHVAAFREHLSRLKAQAAPRVLMDVPERCAAYDPAKCMVQGGDAANCGQSEMCRACGVTRPVM